MAWGDTLLDDNFYNGAAWRIGLAHFLNHTQPHSFDLKIMPPRKDAPIFPPTRAWPDFGDTDDLDELDGIKAIPVYEVDANLSD